MFRQLTQAAEHVVMRASYSRRAFFGTLARRGAAVALAIGSFMLGSGKSHAACVRACIFPNLGCRDGLTEQQCLDGMGTYLGDGTTCPDDDIV